MSTPRFSWLPVTLLLALHVPGAFAQTAMSPALSTDLSPALASVAAPAPSTSDTERLHANAVASFRQARFSEAFGRLIPLANAGHAPSAELALWMYTNGPSLFGKDWDSNQDQLAGWAKAARQQAPVMLVRHDPQTPVAGAKHSR